MRAATILILAAILAGCGSPSSPSPTSPASPTSTAPSPATDVRVLDVAELRAAIAAQRAGGLAPQHVIADVAIDAARRTAPLSRECDPVGHCQVIGTLAGFEDPDRTIAIRQEDLILPPPITPADLRPPVALRLSGQGPIEYLGYMGYAEDNTFVRPIETLLDLSQMPRGPLTVIASGWLVDGGPVIPCPSQVPDVPPDTPFEICGDAWLSRDEFQPVASGSGGGWTVAAPPVAIKVQPRAYWVFAPNPAFAADGVAHRPRFGTFLIRLVSNPPLATLPERGWQIVARLEP